MSNVLPKDAKERKTYPLWTGLFMYFPDALAEVAHLSYVGNQQHNPNQPLHWAREKSNDQEDTLLRHLLESGTVDVDGVRHSVKVAWRALAKAQLEIEAAKEKDPDDKDIPPPEAPDYIEFVPGSRLEVPAKADPREFAENQRTLIATINELIDEGYEARLAYEEVSNCTVVDLSKVADPLGRNFLVWGKLQKSSDRKRRKIQPRRNDSSTPFPANGHLGACDLWIGKKCSCSHKR